MRLIISSLVARRAMKRQALGNDVESAREKAVRAKTGLDGHVALPLHVIKLAEQMAMTAKLTSMLPNSLQSSQWHSRSTPGRSSEMSSPL